MERGWVQPRPALDRRLDGALTHRLTTLVAATGYGKSIALAGWCKAVGGVLHRLGPADRDLPTLAGAVAAALSEAVPDLPADLITTAQAPLGPDADEPARAAALAGALTEALGGRLRRGLALVFDGVEEIAGAPGAVRYVETLVRAAPRHLHLITASRAPLPFPTARLRQDHEVLDLDATDLALTQEETAAWVRDRLGEAGAAVAAALHDACGGWPAAVQAALDALARQDPARWPRTAATLTGSDLTGSDLTGSDLTGSSAAILPATLDAFKDLPAASATLERLTLDAFRDLPAAMRELLRAATVLPVLTGGLTEALGAPPDTLDSLTSRGLFLEAGHEGCRLTQTSAHVLAKHAPLDRHEAHDVAAVAARWYAEHDQPELALRAAVTTRHAGLAATLLDSYGLRLAERGDVIAALDLLPEPARRAPAMLKLAGVAEQSRGHWNRARDLLAGAAGSAGFDAFVARRLGLIDHLRGDYDAALATYGRGFEYGFPPADAAMCAASMASVLWVKGDRAGCAELAELALEQAGSVGDPAALAMANTVLAMLAALDGDRRANDAYYLRALEYAERAGDVFQLIRIHANRASRHLDEGAYADALAETDHAVRLADLVSFAPYAALNAANRAGALIGLGRLEEAATEAEAAVAGWEAMGSRLVGYGLARQAEVHALRGDRRSAAAIYRRIIAEAPSDDVQNLSAALNALAELLSHDEPEEAARVAERALEHAAGIAGVSARVVAARVALAMGWPDRARELLDETWPLAVRRRDHAALAGVTELRAQLDADADLAEAAVREWAAIGDPVGQARAELVWAALADPATGRETAARVRERLHAIGCRSLDDRVDALVARAAPAPGAAVVVETMGTFRVLRGGVPVARTAWQSRKARDLLKILVSRRGSAISRERLVEILWPDQEDEAVGLRRLNVMVSTLRAVLDPERERPPDDLVVSEEGALRLDLSHAEVDVEKFLDLVGVAARLDQAGRTAEALERWAAAESAYGGEFCAEDPYADWAVGLREEARLAYVQAAARLAEASAAARRHDEAARYWLRLLERDRYDERAHLGLVRVLDLAGRRGDARRRYHLYAERMRELEVEPAPYPT
ncbi:MAG TPA: BTAD domain-containing putative transcriptional regulator [Nonomuraea sp.]|nr:BTAD domain-containing putative transcriptional regulator [Nonomuraea sp.]